MPPTKIGTLVVVVLKARNLPNPGMYKQSPYILARLGGGGKRTKIDVKGGQHPVWDEDLHFEIYPQDMSDGGPRVLKLTCYVEGRKKVDESIGEGELAVDDVLETGEFDGWVPLSLNGTQRGEVYLELTWFVNAQRLGRRPSKLSPAERLYRPSPQSPGGSPRPSSSHSNNSSPGRAPLSLPPPVGVPGASSTPLGGRTPPLSLPPRQQQQQQQQTPPQTLGVPPQSYAYPATPPLTPPSYPSSSSQPAARPVDNHNAYTYYDPLAQRGVPPPPPTADPAGGIPASLRPGRPTNGVAYLDPFNPPTLPPRPAEPISNVAPPPPALPQPQPQAAPSPAQPKEESEALRAQRLAWEERDRRKKQEQEDEAFARQLMLEEEENERAVQRQAQPPADGRNLPGGWTDE